MYPVITIIHKIKHPSEKWSSYAFRNRVMLPEVFGYRIGNSIKTPYAGIKVAANFSYMFL